MKKQIKENLMTIILLMIMLIIIARNTASLFSYTSHSDTNNTITINVGEIKKPTTAPEDHNKRINLDGNLYEPKWDSEAKHIIVPGISFEKDPYVGIGKGSKDAVVYVFVDNKFSNKVYFNLNDGWEVVEAVVGYEEGTYTSGLFKYIKELNDAITRDVWTDNPVFSNVIIDETATENDFELAEEEKFGLTVTSYIHQSRDEKGNKLDEDFILSAVKKIFGI